MLEQHVMRTGLGIKGAARLQGTVSVDGPRFRIDGRMEGQEGAFDGNAVDRFGGELAWSSDGVVLRQPRAPGPRGRGHPRRRRAFGLPAPHPHPRAGQGRRCRSPAPGGLPLRPPSDRRLRHRGSAAWSGPRAGSGRSRAPSNSTSPSARTDGPRSPGVSNGAPIKGSSASSAPTCARPRPGPGSRAAWSATTGADLALDADSTDLRGDRRAASPGAASARATARPNPWVSPAPGLFRGRWRGTLGAPVFEGRFSGRDLGYAGVDWGKAEWAGSADAGAVRSHSLVLSRGGAELWLDGLVETGFFGAEDALDARVRL